MPFLSATQGMTTTVYSNLFVKLPYPEGNLQGQTIIVSGSNQGLGFEASRHILRLGAGRLIMAVRNLTKGEAAKKELLTTTNTDRNPDTIEVWELDMDSYSSVKAFAARVATLPRLDAFIANAGLATPTFTLSEDNERTITVNVVSTFLLIALLIPKMRETATSFGVLPIISVVNSALHYVVPLGEVEGKQKSIFARLNDSKSANMQVRYAMSKLLVLFAVRAFAEYLGKRPEPLVVINTPNPSYCKSQLLRESPSAVARLAENLLARSTEMGSRALVNGILADESSNGQYLTNCQVHE